MTQRIDPGETGSVSVRLESPEEKGDFKSPVVINFANDKSRQTVFWVTGKIAPPIEFEPFAAFYVATQRGESKQASIDIFNHDNEPLEILRMENPGARFTTELETLEPGRHYRLSLTLSGDGPAGKQQDTITLVTSSRRHPFLEIKANTDIKERVYTFPDVVDFGRIQPYALKSRPQMISFLTQTLMVYQVGGKDFQIAVSTDVPFVQLSPAQSTMKDRYQIEVTVIPEKLESGEVNGSIVVMTNDPEFPRLTIPVKAIVEGRW
jgi:hypothetical protein